MKIFLRDAFLFPAYFIEDLVERLFAHALSRDQRSEHIHKDQAAGSDLCLLIAGLDTIFLAFDLCKNQITNQLCLTLIALEQQIFKGAMLLGAELCPDMKQPEFLPFLLRNVPLVPLQAEAENPPLLSREEAIRRP